MEKINLNSLHQKGLEAVLIGNTIDFRIKNNNHVHWFNLSELCNYLPNKPSKHTIYSWVRSGKIPYFKERNRLRFLKSEIDAWLQNRQRHVTTIHVHYHIHTSQQENSHKKTKLLPLLLFLIQFVLNHWQDIKNLIFMFYNSVF